MATWVKTDVVTSNGTWTPTQSATYYKVYAIGAGGGGGASSTDGGRESIATGGGGGGTAVRRYYGISSGTVSIGSGGAGASAVSGGGSVRTGSTGGSTTFSASGQTTITANGGSRGAVGIIGLGTGNQSTTGSGYGWGSAPSAPGGTASGGEANYTGGSAPGGSIGGDSEQASSGGGPGFIANGNAGLITKVASPSPTKPSDSTTALSSYTFRSGTGFTSAGSGAGGTYAAGAAANFGAGGGGGAVESATVSGGAGSNGVVIIEYYNSPAGTPLTNPVDADNIVDRFADFVVETANDSIIWSSSNRPFPEAPSSDFGSASGKAISIDGSDVTPANNIITKANIYNTLISETTKYTSIRKIRARLLISTGAGNKTREANTGFDQTNVSHMSGTGYQGTITGVAALGAKPEVNDLETFFTNLETKYNTNRNTTQNYTKSVCHSSCHNSCHNSRGRR
jgi:hypothetical protein